jgi:hypothetical protein
MDCEKFEPLLLDELYEELDEVTSAAVKRHVSGCARCASILNGMRSTRRLAVLPMLAIPDGLEDRILASVKEAQKVVPIQSRASRALSWAGSWAMRPQTAMAAVFLLMIGTSAFVIRSRHSSEQAAAVSVTEQGAPAGQTAPADDNLQSLDNKAAAAAHGPNQPAPITAPPIATVAPAASALALAPDPAAGPAGVVDGLTGGKGRPSKEGESFGSTLAGDDTAATRGAAANKDKNDEQRRAAADALEKEQKVAPRPMARTGPSDISNAGVPGGAPPPAANTFADRDGEFAPRAPAVQSPATKKADQPQDGYSQGMAAYRSRNYPEAQRQFDNAARSGDQNAALWAAKAVKDGSGGCGAAIPRFDSVAQKASGSYTGNEATLESARCQIQMGQLDAARQKLNSLASSSTHAQQAQQALNDLNQVASKREAAKAGAGGGSGAARPAAPAPVRAPAAKPASTAAGF